MHVLTLVGARPQFVKASMLSRAFDKCGIEETIVHSGQHYDKRISQIFFEELQIPLPSFNLEVGSATHAKQTGEIMIRLESYFDSIHPVECLVVYGDTNTTLAGSLVAAKKGIPLVHVEAGLRSFNMAMPEEVNRIITDKLSAFLFCPTDTALRNLENEGIRTGTFLSGDVMYDATLHFSELADSMESQLEPYLESIDKFYLSTIHRPSNTDDSEQLQRIIGALHDLEFPVIFPVHPRTKARLSNIELPDSIRVLPPVSYLQMLYLIKRAETVITDSGGLQKEAYWLKKPCITLRSETEWVETLQGGWNQLVMEKVKFLGNLVKNTPDLDTPQLAFGQPKQGGSSSEFIAQTLLKSFY